MIVMNLPEFAVILSLALSSVTCNLSMVSADRSKTVPFNDRIAQVQNETESTCTSIQNIMLAMARKFVSLIQDAPDKCPAFNKMKKDLNNIGNQALDYRAALEEASLICQQQVKMLTKGLESGSMVLYYLKKANYTLATEIVDKWHQSFENYSAKFNMWHIPMDNMLKNKRIFHHEDAAQGVVLSIVRIALTLLGSIAAALLVTFLLSKCGIFNALDTLFQDPEQQQQLQVSDDDRSPQTADANLPDEHQGVTRRRKTPNLQPAPDQRRETRPPSKHIRILHLISIGLIFFILIAVILLFNPQAISAPEPKRYIWYPEALATLESMKKDLDALEANVSQQTNALIEFQRYSRLYLDEKFQGTVKELVANVVGAMKQAHVELLDTYAVGIKLDTSMEKAYKSIEGKALKTGKTEVAKPLLDKLSKFKTEVEILQHHLYTAVHEQVKVIPVLKQQTESMRKLLRNRRLVEIGELAEKHIDTVIHIDGQMHKVTLVVKDVLDIVRSDGNDAVEKEIKSLQKNVDDEQNNALWDGVKGLLAGAGGVTASTYGLSIVTVIAAPAVLPLISIAGVLSSVGFAGHVLVKSVHTYRNEGDFKDELKDLEIFLSNFESSIARLQNVTESQKQYLKSTRLALSRLAKHCSGLQTISSVVIPDELQQAITDELDTLIIEYTRLIGKLSLFDDRMPERGQIGRQ